MNHISYSVRISVLTLGIALLPIISQPAVSIQNIDAAAEPLRTHFNAAAGKVRAIFLVSPT